MTDPQTEAAAILEFAESHALADTVDLSHDRILVRRRDGDGNESWEPHSTRDPRLLPPLPDDITGTTEVYTPASYVDAVKRYEHADQITYVDQPNSRLVTVLDPSTAEGPGRCAHRVSLTLRHTPEFLAWQQGAGLGTQEHFALRIQDGELEIAEPSAATMLEIAETFHATASSKLKSGKRLQDGRRQFVFEEDTSASAGEDGTVEIPEKFKIALPIYVGGDRYELWCRLVWRTRPSFTIGYTLIRPEVVLDHAFASIVGEVTGEIDGLVLTAPAP